MTATAPVILPTRTTSRVEFRVAAPADDAELRRLLRDNPMAGDIRLSFEREPGYFAAAGIEGPEHRTIVAVEGGRVVCAGSISAKVRYVNGRPTRVGYLGGLRLDATSRNRMSIVRRGYELFRELHERDGGPPVYLTSIVADNLPARRLLERGLPGMPTYQFLGEFVTLGVRRGDFFKPTALVRRRFRERGLQLHYGDPSHMPAVVELLNRENAAYQFAPVWSADDLRSASTCPGLLPGDFRLVHRPDGASVACAALWDQRAVKQTIVRGYSQRLHRFRPWLNVAARLAGRPTLPPVGHAISQAFVSHVVAPEPETLQRLIELLHGPAHTRNIDYLTLGLDARDPRLDHLRKRFRPREYVSRLYAVYWDGAGADLARGLDGRLLAPEVALL